MFSGISKNGKFIEEWDPPVSHSVVRHSTLIGWPGRCCAHDGVRPLRQPCLKPLPFTMPPDCACPSVAPLPFTHRLPVGMPRAGCACSLKSRLFGCASPRHATSVWSLSERLSRQSEPLLLEHHRSSTRRPDPLTRPASTVPLHRTAPTVHPWLCPCSTGAGCRVGKHRATLEQLRNNSIPGSYHSTELAPAMLLRIYHTTADSRPWWAPCLSVSRNSLPTMLASRIRPTAAAPVFPATSQAPP
jgi:hypothetical protein